MPLPRPKSVARGFTLLEMLVSLAVSLIVTALATTALVGFDKDRAVRQKVTEVQEDSRAVLGWLEEDLRAASLGSGTGIIWTSSGGSRVARPAVQIFANVPGGGTLANVNVKPGTDALLVVRALATPSATVVGHHYSSTAPISVSTAAGFAAAAPVLLGDYGEASWGTVAAADTSATPNQITLADLAVNVLPGRQVQRLAAGGFVRAARARLYYVSTADELVRLTLTVPRAPAAASEITQREVLARGIENMQIGCQADAGLAAFQACPAALASSDAISAESAAAFGAFVAAGQGPVLDADPAAGRILTLRTVQLSLAARSQRDVAGTVGGGDPPIALGGVTLQVGSASGVSATAAFVRRAYQVEAAVRNTSLGAL